MDYSFDREENRRGTRSIKWDTVDDHVLSLGIADMDFKTAPEISSALTNAAKNEIFGYSLENEELISSILQWYQNTYHSVIKREWLVFLPGLIPGLNVACSLANRSVLTTVPNYSLLLNAPGTAGKLLSRSRLARNDGRYEMDFADLRRRATADTDLFLFCNPHNPVGRVYTRSELEELSDFCKERHLIVVSDEIHCEFAYDRPHLPFIEVNEYSKKYGITLMSPAKTFNLAGIPFAFAIIPNTAIRANFIKAGFGLAHPGILSQRAAAAAYGEAQNWKIAMLDYLRNNRDYLENELKRRFPKAVFPHVEGTYLQWIDFRAYGITQPYEWFLKNASVSLTDGTGFGDGGCVRMNFATSRSVLAEALDRMQQAVQSLS